MELNSGLEDEVKQLTEALRNAESSLGDNQLTDIQKEMAEQIE